MDISGKILLVTAGVVGYLYYSVYKAISTLVINIKKVGINLITDKYIRLSIALGVVNSSNQNLTFNKVDIKLFLNNRYAGNFDNPYSQTIIKNKNGELYFTVDVLYSTIGKELFEVLKNGSDYNISLSIQGSAYFNGLPVPIPQVNVTNVSFKELLSWI